MLRIFLYMAVLLSTPDSVIRHLETHITKSQKCLSKFHKQSFHAGLKFPLALTVYMPEL